MEIGTMISLGSMAISGAKAPYDVVSDIRKSRGQKPIVQQLERMNTTVEKLSDHIYYAPNMQAVRDTEVRVQRVVEDLRDVRRALEDVQRVVNSDILSSAMIWTPDKMKRAVTANPWQVLIDPRPASMTSQHSNPDMVPIHFRHDGISYIGWQLRGTMPLLFNCEYDSFGIEWGVTAGGISAPRPISFDWVTIPAGEFTMGSDDSDSMASRNEKPQHQVYLDEYRIARTPVTNAQYQAFVESIGHRSPWHWNNGQIPSGKRDHPVVYVSWQDAVAFCTWAGVRLPTEAEWEKAARGTDGRIWPWGNQKPTVSHCNFGGNVGDTTPVGRYPAGASPYGLLDVAGNVWEWTSSLYREYPYRGGDGREDPNVSGNRVLRGGSFHYHVASSCAARPGTTSIQATISTTFGFRAASHGFPSGFS
jgi:serine/threonine-protein kinase